MIRARQIQRARFSSGREKVFCNAQMSPRYIRTFCELSADCERLLERAMTQKGSAPVPTTASWKEREPLQTLEGAPQLEPEHIAEAVQYSTLDRTFWAWSEGGGT